MRRLVREGKINPLVRQTAVDITTGLLQKDRLGEIKALHRFVRDRIRYVRDIHGVETLHTPEKILQNKAGDCDDKTVLLASLLESLGFTTRLVAVGFEPPVKNFFGALVAKSYSHVFPEVFLSGKWIALETTEPVDVGWRPKKVTSAIVVSNSDTPTKMFGELAGKRVKAAMAAESAKLVAARAVAAAPGATPESIAAAAAAEDEYNSFMASHAMARAKKKQKAIKKWGIVATIVSIVVGVFTFGAGGAVLQSAFEAVKQGALAVAKALLLGAAASAAKKGASKKDVAAAQQAANDLEKYPPDKNLPSLDAMIENSQAKKQKAQTAAVAIPLAIGAFTLFS